MNEIDLEFWDDIFERQVYENIDKDTLLKLIVYVKDMKKYLSVMKKEFEEIYTNFEAGIKPQKLKEKGVQHNAACSSATTQQTENSEAEESDKLNEIKKELAESLEMMESKKEQTPDSSSSEIDVETIEPTRDNKHLLLVEIMLQDEIERVQEQIENFVSRHMKENVWHFKVLEFCLEKIDLINNMLELEDKVLNLKLTREQERMTNEVQTIGVEMINVSSKIDEEMRKLMITNEYLQFVQTTRLKEIERIFLQLQIYRNKYIKPAGYREHRNRITLRLEMMKSILKKKVINFDLQIEIKDIKPEDIEAFDVSSNVGNVKNRLMINNKYLRHLVKKYQNDINYIYHHLKKYYDEYIISIDKKNIAAHSNVGTDEIEKINILSKIDKSKLRKSIQYYRSFKHLQETEFVTIRDGLAMYSDTHNEPKKTILMHTEPYDPTKMSKTENRLKKDNEYLAFIAMMHLQKIEEICVFFQLYEIRFINVLENISKIKNFMSQNTYVNSEVLNICGSILDLKEDLKKIKDVLNKTS